jgi:hypothetical protein
MADLVAPIDASLAGAARDTGMAIARAVLALDREIAAAARDVDPAELQHLDERLAALGSSPDAQSDAKRKLRALVEGQAALLRQLAHRHDELVMRREALAERMRTLWLSLANLRAGSAGSAGSTGTGTAAPSGEEVRKLVAEIDSLSTAVREVELLTHPAHTR